MAKNKEKTLKTINNQIKLYILTLHINIELFFGLKKYIYFFKYDHKIHRIITHVDISFPRCHFAAAPMLRLRTYVHTYPDEGAWVARKAESRARKESLEYRSRSSFLSSMAAKAKRADAMKRMA